jgi:hypothetical protein
MKYAVINEQGGINRISDKPILHHPEGTTVVELTDEQAAQVQQGLNSTPRQFYFFVDGSLLTREEKRLASMSVEQKIRLGEKFVENAGFTAQRLVTLMDILLQVKENNQQQQRPKLIAVYNWLQTVKQMALQGNINFPPAPHTFEEVLSEQA